MSATPMALAAAVCVCLALTAFHQDRTARRRAGRLFGPVGPRRRLHVLRLHLASVLASLRRRRHSEGGMGPSTVDALASPTPSANDSPRSTLPAKASHTPTPIVPRPRQPSAPQRLEATGAARTLPPQGSGLPEGSSGRRGRRGAGSHRSPIGHAGTAPPERGGRRARPGRAAGPPGRKPDGTAASGPRPGGGARRVAVGPWQGSGESGVEGFKRIEDSGKAGRSTTLWAVPVSPPEVASGAGPVGSAPSAARGPGADGAAHGLSAGTALGGLWTAWSGRRAVRSWWAVGLGVFAAGAASGVVTRSPVPVLAGAVAVPLAVRMLRRRADRRVAERSAAAVAALCAALAADLRAGQPPHAALADAVETAGWSTVPELAQAAGLLLSAARFGGDVPHALRGAAGSRPGLRGLAAVAACWQVAVDGGAGLAAALDRAAAALRAEADQREDLRAQLAGPRSTAVLLALLPVFGLVLGAGLGADPSAVLLHTPAGLACLGAGALLEAAGLAWTAWIIKDAEGGPT